MPADQPVTTLADLPCRISYVVPDCARLVEHPEPISSGSQANGKVCVLPPSKPVEIADAACGGSGEHYCAGLDETNVGHQILRNGLVRAGRSWRLQECKVAAPVDDDTRKDDGLRRFSEDFQRTLKMSRAHLVVRVKQGDEFAAGEVNSFVARYVCS